MNLALSNETLTTTNPAKDLPVLKHFFTFSFLPGNAPRQVPI